jgi:hypothetical protein
MIYLIETIYSPPHRVDRLWGSGFYDNLQTLLSDDNAKYGRDLDTLWKRATTLLGHGDLRKATIISSRCGQVVYPAFFESTHFMGKGYLQLCAFPGFLNMNGMRFDSLIEDYLDPTLYLRAPRTVEAGQKFRVPTTFVSPRPMSEPHASLRWRISVYDDCLRGRLGLGSSDNYTTRSAWRLITMMPELLLTPPCGHEPDSPAGDLAERFNLGEGLLLSARRDYRRQLFKAVQCVTDLYLREMGFVSHVVVHAEGCTRCALKLCLDSDSRILIS